MCKSKIKIIVDKMMGIVFVDFIGYFFNNLEIMADKKRNICKRVGRFISS